MDPLERTNLALSASAVAASWMLASPHFTVSLAAGAVLESVNFHGLRRGAHFMFTGEIEGSRGWMGLLGFRFGLLVIGIATALHFDADPVGLLVGLSIVMPAVIFEAWRQRPPIDPNAPALAPDDPAWDRWNPWTASERSEDEKDDE